MQKNNVGEIKPIPKKSNKTIREKMHFKDKILTNDSFEFMTLTSNHDTKMLQTLETRKGNQKDNNTSKSDYSKRVVKSSLIKNHIDNKGNPIFFNLNPKSFEQKNKIRNNSYESRISAYVENDVIMPQNEPKKTSVDKEVMDKKKSVSIMERIKKQKSQTVFNENKYPLSSNQGNSKISKKLGLDSVSQNVLFKPSVSKDKNIDYARKLPCKNIQNKYSLIQKNTTPYPQHNNTQRSSANDEFLEQDLTEVNFLIDQLEAYLSRRNDVTAVEKIIWSAITS